MTKGLSEKWIVGALAVSLAACAWNPAGNAPPEVLEKAMESSESGHKAFSAGQHDEAIRAYGAALELHRSVENGPGIVRNLVNLAVVSDSAGRSGDASEYLAALDRYLATVQATTPSELATKEMKEVLTEARWLRAKRSLEAGDIVAARAWLAAARATAGGSQAAAAGRCDNLEARICEESGDAAGAVRWARRGAAANRRAGEKAEEADAWRIAGRGLLAGGDARGAGEAFEMALEIDRTLARTREVGQDLEGLARAAEAAGDPGRAAVFRERARAVQRARGG